ncbi:MAG: cytochrome c [Rhodospirillaceae bacterium]|jgi:mono/diheme cytochrome c family protein|nr:cytochrome c [Rhodospirillaceae bacterium]
MINIFRISLAVFVAGAALAAFSTFGSSSQTGERLHTNTKAEAPMGKSEARPFLFAQLDDNSESHLSKDWDPVAGDEIYNETCVACHGEDGTGEVPGAPDFTQQDGVLVQADDILMKHIEDGFQSPGAMLEMPAKGGDDSLEMDDIMNVLSYLHKKFHYKVEF